MIEKIEKYRTSDGVEFLKLEDAERYESLIGKNLTLEDFQWMRKVSHDFYKFVPYRAYDKKFKCGDIIHTVDWHCLQDPSGNDVDQDLDFINVSIITGTYKIIKESDYGYECEELEGIFSEHKGMRAFIGNVVILENFK